MGPRVLVAFATKHGSTREIADEIGRVLQDAGLHATVAPARGVADLTDDDAVVLGSALYAAHWQRDANRFVARHLAELRLRPVWLFSSGPLDRSADAGTLPAAPSVAITTDPIEARGHRTFGGRLLADTPGWIRTSCRPTRSATSAIGRPSGPGHGPSRSSLPPHPRTRDRPAAAPRTTRRPRSGRSTGCSGTGMSPGG